MTRTPKNLPEYIRWRDSLLARGDRVIYSHDRYERLQHGVHTRQPLDDYTANLIHEGREKLIVWTWGDGGELQGLRWKD